MSQIRFSAEANRDIEEISNYLFDLNPTAAYRLLDALDETCQHLAEHPQIGRTRADLGEDLRSFPVGNYLVFYVAAADGIAVARVVYGGRNLPKVFQRP